MGIEPRFHSSSVRRAVTTPAEIFLPPRTDDSKPRTEVTKVAIIYIKSHRNGLHQFRKYFWRGRGEGNGGGGKPFVGALMYVTT